MTTEETVPADKQNSMCGSHSISLVSSRLLCFHVSIQERSRPGTWWSRKSWEGMDIFIIIPRGLHPAQTKIFRDKTGGDSWSEAGWSQATRLAKQNEKNRPKTSISPVPLPVHTLAGRMFDNAIRRTIQTNGERIRGSTSPSVCKPSANQSPDPPRRFDYLRR